MKKYILLLVISFSALIAKAQDTTTYTSIQDSLYQHLDKEKIITGVLYDRVYPWAGLDIFVAENAKDTLDFSFVKQAWTELYLSPYQK